MPITLNHSNIGVQYSTGSNYIIETVKSDLYRRNEIYDSIVRDNIQVAPVTPSIYIENGTNNVYAVESYTYSGTANTADFTRVFPKSTTCDILIVGGGGSGDRQIGGGGGGGAVLHATNITIPANTYIIKVGKGGSNGNGGNSEAFGATCLGGGSTAYVEWSASNNGTAGGSGSGGSGGISGSATATGGTVGTSTKGTLLNSGTLYNGNIGGNGLPQPSGSSQMGGGGGGGAGTAGFNSSQTQYTTRSSWIAGGRPSKGGDGVAINITGTTYYWGAGGGGAGHFSHAGDGGLGGGGGGGVDSSIIGLAGIEGINSGINGSSTDTQNGGNGAPNTGSGGGGGGYNNQSATNNGGNGGSGIVIIRYLLGTIPSTNYLTTEPVVIAPTFTETTRTFAHSGGAETQTTHTITVGRDTICDILVVAGGGGGGKFGGGGGSGAILFASNLLLNTGTCTIKVGKGGLGVSTDTQNGNNGQDSSIIINGVEYIAKGGGGGGTRDGFNGRNGNNGGSGGGGSHSNSTTVRGLGGVSNKNTYTGWLSYGNNGGNGRLGVDGSDPNHASGGGGGAGSAGGDFSNSTGGGNGGSGLNFSSTFGSSIGHSGWFGGGGGGGTYQGAGNPGYGNGGNGLLGGGGNGGFDGGTELAAQDGLPNTGGGGGGSKWDGGIAEDLNGGHGGSGIVIIKFKSTTAILEGITHKRLNFAFDRLGYSFDATKSVEYQAQLKTGVGDWRIVRFLPPNIGRWYQGNYISNSTFTIPTIGTPYNYTNEWAVPFGTFDEMVFGTLGMTYWLRCLKTSVLGTYDQVARPIISSSFSSTPYSAIWYNRSYGIDPVISIQNYPTQVVYIEDNSPNDLSLLQLDGGMCVLVRDSTLSTTIPNPNTYSLNFPVPTLADINNNSNIVLRGAYDIALSTSNALIIPKTGQYIPKPTTFTNNSVERMYPPVRNFTTDTTIVSGQTYGNGTYILSASSYYNLSILENPYYIFNNTSTGWTTLTAYGASRQQSGSFTLGGFSGEWIKVQLPIRIKMTRYILQHGQYGGGRSPSVYKIFGSNDNITWTEVVNKSIDLLLSNYSNNMFEESVNINDYYSYYALVVNKVIDVSQFLTVGEWYIYGQELLPSSLSLRYHLLNPTLDPIGAQWTYSSNNTNVYHMGSVGIGTTSPEYQLDVRGNIFTSAGGYTQTGSENWVVQSDRRIKENIVKASYEKCLDNVKKIELYNFNFKDNCVNTNDKNQLGFIAQEVQQVYPKAVEVGRMTLDNNHGINDLLTLNTTQIKYTLYGAVKNLIERVENIESRVEQIYNMTLSSNIKSSSSNISITFITPIPALTTNSSSSNITTNTSNITTNTSNITTNTSNITTNTSNITTNTSNI